MKRMRLIVRLRVLVLTLLLVSLLAVAMSLWSVRHSRFHLERMNLAHQEYEGYLSLSSNTYQLFKQYGDALIIGDTDDGNGEQALIDAVRGDINRIREHVAAEIELRGEDDSSELLALSRMEFKIETLSRALEHVLDRGLPQTVTSQDFLGYWQQLSHILDSEIDETFHRLINSALEGEAMEVAEVRAQVEHELIILSSLAGLIGLLAAAVATFSLWMLNRRVKEPMVQLVSAVRGFGEGSMQQRVGMGGDDELAEIGAAFDNMANRVEANARRLSEQNTALEQAVAERTEQLERMLEQARRSQASRRQLLSDVSHELRTPLTIIQGEADVALRGAEKAPAVYRDALMRSRDAARHTAGLVNDLLFVARSEEGHARLQVDTVDLKALVSDTAVTLGQSVLLDLPQNDVQVRCDRSRIAQVLLVLLDNARNHGGDRIVLHLHVENPACCVIQVEDNGDGMNDNEKINAFERYYRGASAAGRYQAGVGLGLPVARAIMQAHGGHIELLDRSGGGLIAEIRLPMHERPGVAT